MSRKTKSETKNIRVRVVDPARLKAVREKAGLTQTEVADRIKALDPTRYHSMTGGYVSQFESGGRAPKTTMLDLLAQLYGVAVDSLLVPTRSIRQQQQARRARGG